MIDSLQATPRNAAPTSLLTLASGQKDAELTSTQKAKLEEVTSGFESIFMSMLLEPLDEISKAFFGDGPGSKIFGGMYRQQMADAMAQAKPLGLGKLVETAMRSRVLQMEDIDSGLEEMGQIEKSGADSSIQTKIGDYMAMQSYGRDSK